MYACFLQAEKLKLKTMNFHKRYSKVRFIRNYFKRLKRIYCSIIVAIKQWSGRLVESQQFLHYELLLKFCKWSLNRDDGGALPDGYLYLVRKKGQLISEYVKGPIVAVIRSSLMKALDRSVETLGLWIVTSSVTFIKSANQCSIELCLIVHLVVV